MAAPFKELRFTRSRQAVTFLALGLLCVAAAAAIVVLHRQRIVHPPPLWAALLPMLPAWLCLRTALRLARHAYLLLSPIGIEIFPFFRPADNMQLVSWGEVADASVDDSRRLLTLTLAGFDDAKIIVSLDPMTHQSRELLARAIAGVMAQRGA